MVFTETPKKIDQKNLIHERKVKVQPGPSKTERRSLGVFTVETLLKQCTASNLSLLLWFNIYKCLNLLKFQIFVDIF
jgi:hypothetical protein